jgi:hypothetical protein
VQDDFVDAIFSPRTVDAASMHRDSWAAGKERIDAAASIA